MPKNKNSMQPNTLTRLFSRLKNTSGTKPTENDQFNDIDLIAPLKKKIDLLNAEAKKSPEEKEILIFTIALLIDCLNAKEEKNPEDEFVLKEMLALLKELANKIPSKTDEVVVEKAVFVESVSQEITSTLAQQLRSVKLKPVNKPAKEENRPPVFVMDKEVLANISLNPVKRKNSVTSNQDEDKLTELEIKLAKQRALIEVESVNIDSVTREENFSENVDTNKTLSFYETRLRALSVIEEVESQRNSIFLMPVNEEHATDSDSDDIQKELQELQEFEEIEANISLEAFLRQGLEDAEKQLEEVLQSLMRDCDNKNTKPINAPISAYFKNLSSIEDSSSKPVIVEAVLKPMP